MVIQMIKLVYKIIPFILIFFLVFNNTSICHAYNYKTNKNNEIKLDIKSSFFLKEDVINLLQVENNINKPNNEIFPQFLVSYFLTTLTFIPLSTALLYIIYFLFVISGLISSPLLILIFAFPIIFPFLNSIYVYNVGIQKEKHSYWATFWGSIYGILAYSIIIVSSVVFESYFSKNKSDAIVTNNQELLLIFLMPLFASVGGVISYHLSKNEDKKENKISENENSNDLEKFRNMERQINSFSEKIKVSKGSVAFNIVSF